jgi:hypothetical protein
MASFQTPASAGNTRYCVRSRRTEFHSSRRHSTSRPRHDFADSIEADIEGQRMPEVATLNDLLDRYAPHAAAIVGTWIPSTRAGKKATTKGGPA